MASGNFSRIVSMTAWATSGGRAGRPEEELQERGDTGKSLREIGREIAKEIERVFDAKVNPISLGRRAAEKDAARNRSHPQTPATAPVQAGNTGNTEDAISEISRLHGEICNAGGELLVETLARKLTPQEVVVQVDAIVKKGKSVLLDQQTRGLFCYN